MADTRTISPLPSNQPLVNADGTPTLFFQRWAQARSVEINGNLTPAEAQKLIDNWAAGRKINTSAGLSGGGNLSEDITLRLNAGLVNLKDIDFSTPPTDKQALVYDATASRWKPATVSGGNSPYGAHRYWRINVTQNNGSAAWSIAEVAFFVSPTSTTNEAVGGNASAQSVNNGYVPANAFDGNPATIYAANAPQGWLEYAFPASVEIGKVTLQSRDDGYLSDNPENFNVEYSDDEASWLVAWTVTDQTAWGDGEVRSFNDPNYPSGGGSSYTPPPVVNAVVDGDVAKGTPLAINRANGHLIAADATSYPKSFVVGLAKAAALDTFTVDAVIENITLADWTSIAGTAALMPGVPYFLAEGGGITTARPTTAGSTVVIVGEAVTADTLNPRISPPILI